MNKVRRGELSNCETRILEIAASLRNQQVPPDLADEIDDLKDDLRGLRDEEQEYFDNMADNFRATDRGERAEEVVNLIDSAVYELEDALGWVWEGDLDRAAEDFEGIADKVSEAAS